MSGSQMSIEGVSNKLDENSGEIKVLNYVSSVPIDNSDSENSSVIIMGQNKPDLVSEGGTYNILYKQKENTPDQSALIFKDINGIEDWFKNRTDLVSSTDFDTKTDNMMSFSSDLAAFLNSEATGNVKNISEVKHLPNDNFGESLNVSHVNWDDFSFDPVHFISTLPSNNTNIVFVPDSENTLDCQTEKQTVDRYLNVPNVTILGSPPKLNLSHKKANEQQIVNNNFTNVTVTNDSKPAYQSLCKQFPVVKISKECLIKGKIIGKSNVSFISRKLTHPLLKPQSADKPNLIVSSETEECVTNNNSLINRANISLLRKKPVRLNGNQNILVVPEKQVKKGSNNCVAKVNQRSLLKLNHLSMGDNMTNNVKSSSLIKDQTKKIVNSALPLALVAISTDKSVDTTEIVIKTKDGENVFKGKTSDIMKATGSGSVDASISLKPNSTTAGNLKSNNGDVTMDAMLRSVAGISAEWLESIENPSPQSHLHCPVDNCAYSTTKCDWLKAHVLQHYKIRPFICDYPGCNWAFFTSFRLKRHQEIHFKTKEYLCPIKGCGRSFTTTYNVRSHLKLHERPTSETCTINNCNRSFQTKRSYEKHLKEHGIEYAPYMCDKEGCGKRYFSINSLNTHSRSHQHNVDELKCPHCGKLFDQPCRLKAHVNTHIGVKPYKCEFEDCMWAFTTSSKLRRHQRKHTQTRKHQCLVCSKSFLRSEHLENHVLKHFVKKTFVCPINGCGTVFSNQSTMYAHLKKHRNQAAKINGSTSLFGSMIPCLEDGCGESFNTNEQLQTHQQLVHFATEMVTESSQDPNQLSDDTLITFGNLQESNNSNEDQGVVSYHSLTQEDLLAGMSDLVQCIPATDEGEYSEQNTSNVITHVVFTDDQIDSDNDVLEESAVLEDEEGIGSARTDLTYEAAVKVKRTVSESMSDAADSASAAGLHTASDVVLSASASHDNLEKSLFLQDELSTGDLYNMGGSSQEEVGLLGPGGELQVLLLDPTTRLQHSDFEQSTINLRDLE